MIPLSSHRISEPSIIDWVPTTKLAPEPVESPILPRPHLIDRLDDAVGTARLVVLSTPSGYGKTTLLRLWREQQSGMKVAWLALDASENNSAYFLLALVAALQTIHAQCGHRAKLCLTANGEPLSLNGSSQAHVIAGLILVDVVRYLDEPFVLVLDNFERITEPAVHNALDYLIRRLPAHATVIVSTAHQPPLALARLRIAHMAIHLRTEELAFDATETADYVRSRQVTSITDVGMQALYRETEGWPLGIALAVQAMREVPALRLRLNAVRSVYSDSLGLESLPDIERYFRNELLRHLTSRQRSFLLQTSILDELAPDICEAITGWPEASSITQELYDRNAFLLRAARVDSSTETLQPRYRYHRLFARFLRRQLMTTIPARVAKLHHRAPTAGRAPFHRILPLLAAEEWEAAARLLVEMTDEQRQSRLFATWVAMLPTRVRQKFPALAQWHAEYVGYPPLSPQAEQVGLTERQFAVLRLLSEGASNATIADELVVTLPTVKGHVSQILRKLEATSRHDAVARAAALGILEPVD